MSYSVKQGDIFGRIGSGVGKGLAEQVPKEIERSRLASGLEELSKQSPNLTNFQRFSKLLSIPGMTPQGIQSGAELLKQEGINQELINKRRNENAPQPSPFPKSPKQPNESGGRPSITTRNPIEHTLENYIPRTLEQIQQRAGELLEENPRLYGNEPQKALEAAQNEENRNIAINQAFQQRRQNEQDVQNRIETGLKQQAQTLGTLVPSNIYSRIEDQAINAVKPKSQGGEGLTEQQAKKKYGDELDKISREYQALETIGRPKILPQTPTQIKNELESLRHKFKDRNDLENFAETLVSKGGNSYEKAYAFALPVEDFKKTNNFLAKTPALKLKPRATLENEELINTKTLELAKNLAPIMKTEDASPLAIGQQLQRLGYDPDIWMNYLRKNQKELNLSQRQGREIDKPTNRFGTLSDFWLFTWAGMNKLVEQE